MEAGSLQGNTCGFPGLDDWETVTVKNLCAVQTKLAKISRLEEERFTQGQMWLNRSRQPKSLKKPRWNERNLVTLKVRSGPKPRTKTGSPFQDVDRDRLVRTGPFQFYGRCGVYINFYPLKNIGFSLTDRTSHTKQPQDCNIKQSPPVDGFIFETLLPQSLKKCFSRKTFCFWVAFFFVYT